jgi:hypothetical protein
LTVFSEFNKDAFARTRLIPGIEIIKRVINNK